MLLDVMFWWKETFFTKSIVQNINWCQIQTFRCKIGKSKNEKGLKNQDKIKNPVKSNIEKETISPNKCNFYIESYLW